MSFGGSVSAMITSLKNNARPKKKILFDKKDTNWKNVNSDLKKIPEKKVSKQKLRQIRNKLTAENSRDNYKKFIVLIISILMTGWLFYWFFYT